MKTLQIATTNDRSFFLDQVETLERKGIDCDVIAASPNREEYDEFKRNLGPITSSLIPEKGHNVPYYAANGLLAHPRILKAVLGNDYDIVHTNSGLTAPFALLQPHRPIVQTFWGSDLMGEYLYGYYGRAMRHAAGHFDGVIVRNEEMRDVLDGKAHVIPAGVDMEKFRPIPRENAQRTVGWGPDLRYVLFPYTPEDERKNYPLAKEVVNRVDDRVDADLKLQTVYRVPHDRIPYYMNASDALLLTSSLEGSPNTAKEALACNLPVVSTDVGDVRERLRGVHPSTVADGTEDLVDGLVEVIEHGGRCNGREQVEPLSWDRIGDRIIEVYDEVL